MSEQAYRALAKEFVGDMMKHLRRVDQALICDDCELPKLMKANIVRVRFAMDSRREIGTNIFFQMDFVPGAISAEAYARVVRRRMAGEIEAIRQMTAIPSGKKD